MEKVFLFSTALPSENLSPINKNTDLLITAELVEYCKEHLCKHSFLHATSVLVNMYQQTGIDLNCKPMYSHSSMYGQERVFASCYRLFLLLLQLLFKAESSR